MSKYDICSSNIKEVITTTINDIFHRMTNYFVALYDISLIKIDVQSTLDNSKLTGLLKNFELPRVRIVE